MRDAALTPSERANTTQEVLRGEGLELLREGAVVRHQLQGVQGEGKGQGRGETSDCCHCTILGCYLWGRPVVGRVVQLRRGEGPGLLGRHCVLVRVPRAKQAAVLGAGKGVWGEQLQDAVARPISVPTHCNTF